MKNRDGRLEHRFSHRIEMKFNMVCYLQHICNQFKSVDSFYEGNNFKPCLIKQDSFKYV